MRIECPECSQRFDVTDDFMDKTVECGSCDSRFKVTDEVVMKEKSKFYPGEKRDAHLERFANVKASAVAASKSAQAVDFQQAHYQPDVNAAKVGSPRPRQTVAAAVGVVVMVVMLVIFLLAGGPEGPMRDMETPNRMVLCGFTTLLGCVLVLFGLKANLGRALLLCLVLGGGLMSMPFLFPGNPTSASDSSVVDWKEDAKEVEERGKLSVEDAFREEVGYGPVADALEQYPADSVVAIYVRNAQQILRDKIADYLYEETGKVSRGISYNRGDMRDTGLYGLILLTNQKLTIDEIAALCSRFGRVNKIQRDLRVVDVTVENSKVVKLDPSQSVKPNDSGFYREQLKALMSFDPEVKSKAVVRLGIAEPKAMRDDITQQLLTMLPGSGSNLKLEIINTLGVWSQEGDGAGAVVLTAVRELHTEGKVNKQSMEFLVARKIDGAEVILMELWHKEPVIWSDLLINLGEGAQFLLLPKLTEMDTAHVVAAADILAEVGSKEAVPIMRAALEKLDETGKKSLKASIDEIEKRF